MQTLILATLLFSATPAHKATKPAAHAPQPAPHTAPAPLIEPDHKAHESHAASGPGFMGVNLDIQPGKGYILRGGIDVGYVRSKATDFTQATNGGSWDLTMGVQDARIPFLVAELKLGQRIFDKKEIASGLEARTIATTFMPGFRAQLPLTAPVIGKFGLFASFHAGLGAITTKRESHSQNDSYGMISTGGGIYWSACKNIEVQAAGLYEQIFSKSDLGSDLKISRFLVGATYKFPIMN